MQHFSFLRLQELRWARAPKNSVEMKIHLVLRLLRFQREFQIFTGFRETARRQVMVVSLRFCRMLLQLLAQNFFRVLK